MISNRAWKLRNRYKLPDSQNQVSLLKHQMYFPLEKLFKMSCIQSYCVNLLKIVGQIKIFIYEELTYDRRHELTECV